ncbi:MAG: CotH kinase family protein [Bacteroidales bacterium]
MKKLLLSILLLSLPLATFAQQYCTELGRSTKTDREWFGIEIISSGEQNNIDAYLHSRTDGDCYRGVLNTGNPIVVYPGKTVNLLLNGYMNWTFVHLFADWNSDKDFDDNGEYIEMQPTSKDFFPYGEGADANSRTFNFTVPTDATKGSTRLRLIMAYGINGACTLIRTNDAAIAADIEMIITSTDLDVSRTVKVESADVAQGSAVITGTASDEISSNKVFISVSATPSLGYSFKEWRDKASGKVVSISNPYNYAGTESTTLIACFQEKYVQLTDIPTIFINTENGTEINSKENYIKATVTVRGAAKSKDNITDITAEIKGRGNSTWGMAKKPYRLKFSSKLQFIGNNAKAKNWVLLANYCDKTLMRNALALETARNIFNFGFTPSVTFVDVVLNGKNIGSYTLTDQIEQDENRVNIKKQALTTTASDPEITGGYLVEVDGFADSEISWFKTEREMKVTIKYPKDDEINKDQSAYITKYTQDMENAIFSNNSADSQKGWRKYIDEASLTDWYITCELFGNSDSWWSTYMYKDRDAVYKLGPLWDFDIAFNNDNRLGDATEKMMRIYAHNPKTWIAQWCKDADFIRSVENRWKELRKSGLEKYMTEYIDNTARVLEKSQKNNFSVWDILNSRVHLELTARGSYSAEVSFLKNYVISRINYLDTQFNLPSGIEDATAQTDGFIIAPNPVQSGSDVIICLSESEACNITVAINSIDGKIVMLQDLRYNGGGRLTISGTNFAPGIYVLNVAGEKGVIGHGRLLIK